MYSLHLSWYARTVRKFAGVELFLTMWVDTSFTLNVRYGHSNPPIKTTTNNKKENFLFKKIIIIDYYI